jgi:cathepsin A (carboxypeptidase C)
MKRIPFSFSFVFLVSPCTVNQAGDDTTFNPYSWNSNSSVIFLDQPLNVGYSYGNGGATNTVEAAKHVYAFLQLFFKEFSGKAKECGHLLGLVRTIHFRCSYA